VQDSPDFISPVQNPGLYKMKMVAVKRKTQEEEKKEKFNTGRRV
jgi:hypothetical protein